MTYRIKDHLGLVLNVEPDFISLGISYSNWRSAKEEMTSVPWYLFLTELDSFGVGDEDWGEFISGASKTDRISINLNRFIERTDYEDANELNPTDESMYNQYFEDLVKTFNGLKYGKSYHSSAYDNAITSPHYVDGKLDRFVKEDFNEIIRPILDNLKGDVYLKEGILEWEYIFNNHYLKISGEFVNFRLHTIKNMLGFSPCSPDHVYNNLMKINDIHI